MRSPENIEDAYPTLSDRIHNAIVDRIMAHSFPVVEYVQRHYRQTSQSAVAAQTILVRPQSSAFIESNNRMCGGPLLDRDSWQWVALVHFDRQVSTDAFDEHLMLSPIVVPRVPGQGLQQQATITLTDAQYVHPPEKQSSHGSRVEYRFLVSLSPR